MSEIKEKKGYRERSQWQDKISELFPSEKHELYDRDATSVRTVTFQVTDACNLACTYCYQINKGTHVMEFETAKKFIDLLLDAEESTAQYINSKISDGVIIEFIGGEPFLEIDLINKICDYFVEQLILRDHPWATRHVFSICSNGVLYFDPRVQAFLKKHQHHLSFSISIDGNKELHDSCRVFPDGNGSYDIAMAGVRHFVENFKMDMGSKMTLAPENVMHTYDAVTSLLEEGYEEINLNCVYEEGWNVNHAIVLYNQLKQLADYIIDNEYDNRYISMFVDHAFKPKLLSDTQNWCGGNGRMIAVDYKGDIYPCIRYMESSLGDDVPPIKVGSVDDGIMVKQEHIDCANCLKAVNRITQSDDKCLHCPIAEGCSWCQAYNYQHSGGNINKRATYICIMHQARALANAYYWNKLYRVRGENKRMKLWIPEDWALQIISKEEWDMLKGLEGA